MARQRPPGTAPARWPIAAGLAAGTVLDAIFADPRRGHPVAAFGRAAAALEARVYAGTRTRGAAHTAACLLAVAAPAVAAHQLTRGRPLLRLAVTAAACWSVTGAASLANEAERLALALESGQVAAARGRLPSLCGRDPARLGAAELARAAVESVAENTCDAVVAPLLWGAAAGLTGLVTYRAVNTLDAMVGHRSPRYRDFGWLAARLDDVANAAPARLTGLLAAACAPVVAGRPGVALAAMRDFGARHPSPNAGRCEAAFAGALGVRLGGTNSYAGVVEQRPELGTGRRPTPADIRRAVRLSRAVTWAAAALCVAVAAAGSAAPRTRTAPARVRIVPTRVRTAPAGVSRTGSRTLSDMIMVTSTAISRRNHRDHRKVAMLGRCWPDRVTPARRGQEPRP